MRRGAWAALAVVALGLTGCSDPGTPSDTLPTAASTTAEPTLEPLGPADFPVPDEAREQSEDGAQAAATYYMELTARSLVAGDSSWIRTLSDGCEQCTSTANNLDAVSQAGDSYIGGEVTVTALLPELDSQGRTGVGLVIDQEALQVQGPDGSVRTDRSIPARRLTGGAVLSWDASRAVWVVNQLDLGST